MIASSQTDPDAAETPRRAVGLTASEDSILLNAFRVIPNENEL